MRRSRPFGRAPRRDAAGDAGTPSQRAHSRHQRLVAARLRAAADESRGVNADAGGADDPPAARSDSAATAAGGRRGGLLALRLLLTGSRLRVSLPPASS